MVASIWLRAAHRGVPTFLVTALVLGQSPMALAESPAQRQELIAALRQLDALERTVADSATVSAFQVNSGIAPSAMATVLVGVVFAVLLVWGVWAIRTAYVGWSESRLNQRQFLGVVVRFLAMYLVLTFFLLS